MDSIPSSGPLPDGTWLEQRLDGVALVRRWYSSGTWGLFLFVLIWNVGIGAFIWSGLHSPGRHTPVAFMSLHVLVGLLAIYFLIASFLNRTTIAIDSARVTVRHAPIYWGSPTELERAAIAQVHAETYTPSRQRRSRTYHVVAVSPEGKRRMLLGGLRTADESVAIARELRAQLGLPSPEVAKKD